LNFSDFVRSLFYPEYEAESIGKFQALLLKKFASKEATSTQNLKTLARRFFFSTLPLLVCGFV
jgi:hypothetical protein